MSAKTTDQAPIGTVAIVATNVPDDGLFVGFEHGTSGIESVDLLPKNFDRADVNVHFKSPAQLLPGTYQDTVAIHVCFDDVCAREVVGSPLMLATTYNISGPPAVEVLARTTLPHDVIDAEFSNALGAIVMVSSFPRSSLYVYITATGEERELVLSKIPTSVSIAPDGLTAAVGHDALISYADLTTVGVPAAPAPTLLNVSTDVFDIVLGGNGFAYAFPRRDQWVPVHSIEIATNTERLSTASLWNGSHARLHPSGNSIYTANNGLSPSDIEKWHITNGPAVRAYDSPYHGEHAMCGNVWMKEDGTRVYTRCGNTFSSSAAQPDDMSYRGSLELSAGSQIIALTQSDEAKEIALIDGNPRCDLAGNQADCFTYLNLYDSDFLNRLSLRFIPPVSATGGTYLQRGMFVFHSADGAQLFMISRLPANPNRNQAFYISVLR